MRMSVRAGVIAVSAIALGLSLAGCGSDTKSDPTTSEATSSEAPASTTTTTSAAEATTSAQATGPNYTIVDYIKDNGIVEAPVKRGDPGAPTFDLPTPPGWEDAGPRTPEWAYGAIISTDPAFEADPPSIIALVSKLTGNVDPAKILEFAPGEIRNMPGFEGAEEGTADELSGFDAMQIGGTYKKDGVARAIAQKTVVVPGQDGLYVLQLNADGLEDQIGALMDATSAIDEQTTITP
ncbi:LpqN/LpqT family lipoprotein [Mycobacterium neglectum]|uniref:LpqN/LpqT family lipoprotein n=1 Tax=Mycobacterium neglectum TaxID=242737 RepID=UPI000BFEAA85|nr:LpqN/LpqT family lipoprotein [Mycobacterium neglectum]